MKLTDTECRKVQPKEKRYRLSDKNGLSLLVTLLGQKYWNIHFTVLGERKSESLAPYPDMSLNKARELKYKYSKSVLHIALRIKPLIRKHEGNSIEEVLGTLERKNMSPLFNRYLQREGF